ncbi:MAG: RNA polymerase sigma factor [Proteobacteria bacterium]|nr:RNA polymerase sigma factor [Pseudomonadota bacterium]
MSEEAMTSCLQRIATGDQDAMAELFDLTRPELTRIIASIVPADDADDIFQTAMMRVWRKAGTFRAGSPVMPWLVGIARRAAFDLLRSRKRRAKLWKNNDLQGLLTPSLKEDRREIRQHLDNLPEMQRKIIRLSFFKSLPLKDIAALEGISLFTARTLRRKALNTLKESLNLENLLA